MLIVIIALMGYSLFFLYGAFKEKCGQYDKFKRNFLMLYDWMDLESENTGNRALATLLEKKGYNEIIIYGWGYLGNRLYRELRHTQIQIKGVLDRRGVSNLYNIPSYSLQSQLPEADAVIVTVLSDVEKIRYDVEKIMKCPVVGLEELI